MSALLILAGIVLCMISGLPSLAGKRGLALTAPIIITGALIGMAGSALGLVAAPTEILFAWHVPGGSVHIRVDALAAFFAAPVFLLAGAGGLYAERYWPAARSRAAYVRAFFGLMCGALALVMVAANTMLFLAASEMVAIGAFFLVSTEQEQPEARRAGWIYLATSHIAILALFASFALMHNLTGAWAFTPLAHGAASLPAARAALWLALVAFGIKAGVMPFHFWLPGGHAAAPSHVSAVMSGVVIKMGIYGLVRMLSLFDAVPPAFGVTLLVAGIASSILGVAFALAQHDLKRLLAYHSVENIGIIVTGLGIGLVAQANGQPLVAFLGYAGALLHVWNHSLFKALLFLSAGAAIHASGTREIDRMGGLARLMPWTAGSFLFGAVAISGLPPLNGFVSEWLLYIAGFTSITTPSRGGQGLLLLLVVPALALTGALALACFVKAYGAAFLGSPRTDEAARGHEAPLSMCIAAAPLIAACLAIGLAPMAIAPLLNHAVAIAAPRIGAAADLTVLLRPIQSAAIAVAIIGVVAFLALRAATRRAKTGLTWDCGYTAPTPRMQYTASSIARSLVGYFAWAMPAVVHAPRPLRLFPTGGAFKSHVPDTVLDRGLLPLLRGVRWTLGFARFIQSGRVQLYILYLGATLVVLLAWSAQ